MDTNLLNRTWISGQPVQVDNLTGTAFTGEAGAHTFIIAGKDVYGNDVPITGEITAKFLASNQVTVPLVGSIGNGSAFITLSDTCYLVPGRFVLSIYATNGNYTTCIYCGVGNVFATSSDITAYPTTATPDLNQLIRDVQAAISSVPADYSALINSIATTFDPQKTGGYGIGEYVWYNGVLYRFKEPHTGGWQASHVDQVILANDLTSVAAVASAGVRYDIGQGLSDTQKATARENIGAQEALTIDAAPTQGSTNPVQSGGVYSEVSALKSAFSNITEAVYGKNRWNINSYVSGYLAADGSITPSDTWRTTDFCYVEGFATIIASVRNLSNIQVLQSLFYLCTYDSDKNFIERKWTSGSATAELDSNVAYVRFSYNNPNLTEHQLEEGTTKTAYEPFTEQRVIETDSTLTNPVLPANAKAVGDALANQSVDGVISYAPVTLSLTSGKIISGATGAITDTENTNYRISAPVSVAGCRKIAVSTENNWGQGMVVFFDAGGNFVSGGMKANSGSTNTQIHFQIFDVPTSASTVIIGFNYTTNFPEPFLFKGITQDVKPTELWSGKKWVCVGDSLTAYNTMTSIHYFDYIKATTGINIVNMGVSGSGYAKNNDNFMTRVLNVPTDADVVTIFGSGNDASSGLPLGTATDTGTETLGGVINTTIDNLYSIMPVVQLGIVTPTPWQGNMPSDNGWMENYSNLIKEICNLRSIPCLDLFHCSNLNPNSADVRALAYSNDGGGGVHPNELGHKIIASRFKAFLYSLVI